MKTPEKIKKGLEACIAGECNSKRITCPYRKEGDCMTAVIVDALALIRQLETRLVAANKTLDALKADILRATDKAHEMQSMLDNDVHPNCDYGLYCDLCDALGDVVAWEHKELLEPPGEEV